jgi:hypothetical protein
MTKKPDSVALLILRDGVFIADSERRDANDKCTVPAAVAKTLIERGHAKRV